MITSDKLIRYARQEGGLRIKGHIQSYFQDIPKISVITVVFNGGQRLEKTIQSVIHQEYDNYEYIIIDGASNDCTIDIIRRYEHSIHYWLSEKDCGIYDAMNKGIRYSSGKWIIFLNVGDRFFCKHTLQSLLEYFNQTDLYGIYGNTIIDGDPPTQVIAGNLGNLPLGMQFTHQSFFTRADYLKNNHFNLRYKCSADYDLIYNLWINKCKLVFSNTVISIIEPYAFSEHNILISTIERWKIIGFKSFHINIYYFILIIKLALLRFLIYSFGKSNIDSLLSIKRMICRKLS